MDSHPRVMGFDQTHNTQHWTDEIDNSLLVTYILSLVGQDITHLAGPHGDCTPKQSEQPRAVGGRLCSLKSAEHSLVPAGGCDWFV